MKMAAMRVQLLVVLLAAAFCAGCRVTGGTGIHTPPAGGSDLAAAQKFGDEILEALRKRDYPKLVANIPGDLAEHVTEAGFLASCGKLEDKFGKVQGSRFLTSLDTPAFDNLIWVADFSKPGTNGKPVRRQLLFRVVTMQTDGKKWIVKQDIFPEMQKVAETYRYPR